MGNWSGSAHMVGVGVRAQGGGRKGSEWNQERRMLGPRGASRGDTLIFSASALPTPLTLLTYAFTGT